ncbi:MAG: STAS domain-containing protein [Pseudanabaenaceae cyanobacterium bins.68]|nr:STAS domain-containing protein [Pseudanabaenaceae cyanobacterium bins.68]
MGSVVQTVKPAGRLDVTTAAKFRKEVNDLTAQNLKYLVVDLDDVGFMDSSGLGALVSALKSVKASNGEMVVCGLSEQVQMLFELTSMGKIFKIYGNVQEFLDKENLA